MMMNLTNGHFCHLLKMKFNYDMKVTFDDHLRKGNVYGVVVDLPMRDNGENSCISLLVYVTAPNSSLARYIVEVMYPDGESYSCDEEPVTREEYESGIW